MDNPTATASDHPADRWPPAGRSAARELLRASLPLLIVVGSFVFYFGYGHRPPPERRSESVSAVDVVETLPVESYSGDIEITVEGVVRPYRHVTLAAEVAGRIRHKAAVCEEAMFVPKGTLLFEVDPTDYENEVRRLSQQLDQADNAIKEWQVERENTVKQSELAEADVKLAGREVARLQQLASSKVSTAAEIDQAQRVEISARNTLVALKNQLRLLDARYDRAVSAKAAAQVQLEQARRDLERTKVHAPCDGTVVTENVEEDGYVQPGATMVVINDISQGQVVCQVELEDLYWLWGTRTLPQHHRDAGDTPASSAAAHYEFPRWPAVIEFPFEDVTCRWDGEWIRFGGTGIDPSTRTVPCQVAVARPRHGRLRRGDGSDDRRLPCPPLTVGMFVSVRSQVTPYLPLLNLPGNALRPGSVTWVVREGKLYTIPVRIARRMKEQALVHVDPSGLRAGDRVVVSPLPLVRDGMAVREVAR